MNLNSLSLVFTAFLSAIMPLSSQGEYIFVPSKDNCFMHHAAGVSCMGTIDADGSFVPDLRDLERTIEAIKDNVPSIRVSGPFDLLGKLKVGDKIYEYRASFLIPMVVDGKRGMIPEVGGKIIEFKDYQYSPTARRIYNLPGRFVPKVEKK